MSDQPIIPSNTTTASQWDSNDRTTWKDDIIYLHMSLNVAVGLGIMVFGVTGNVLSFVVLSHDKRSRSARFLLKTLSIVDSIVLLSCSLRDCVNSYSQLMIYPFTDSISAAILRIISYYIVSASRAVSTWLTVLIAGTRYIAIRYPLHAKTKITLGRVRFITVLLVLVSVLLFIPDMYIYSISLCRGLKRCQTNESTDHYYNTPNEVKALTYSWFLAEVMVTIIPLFLLIILSALLLSAFHKYVNLTGHMTEHNSQQERQITLSIIMVVVVLIICQIPSCLYAVKSAVDTYVNYGGVWHYIRLTAEFFLGVNSAVNFIIYGACNKKFRVDLGNMIRNRLCNYNSATP